MSFSGLRFAVRGLLKTPGYTVAFVLTLGLGIGANTAIFSVLDGVLLRPLPHANGERLIYLRHSAKLAGRENTLFSVPEIADYRDQATTMAGVAEFSAMTFNMIGGDEPRRVRSGVVSGNYFRVLGLAPSLGRAMDESDDGEGAASVTVLTDHFWRLFFGADPNVVGKTARMNGRTVTIVGVLQPAPPYPERTDIYVNMVTSPHHMGATMVHDRLHRMTEVFARLAPGATAATAAVEVEQITARLHSEYPDAYDVSHGYDVSVTPLRTQLASRARPTLMVLLGAAGFVLLVACANVANLTLARLTRREGEMAIRAAMGAEQMSLRRQLLVESLVPSVAGAVLGCGLAYAVLDVLKTYAARFSVRSDEIALDLRVFGAAVAIGFGAACFFALVPRLPGSKRDLASTLTSARTTGGAGGRRTQGLLVASQVAVSFILLIGAGLFLRSILHLDAIETGLDTAQVLSLDIPRFAAGRDQGEQNAQYDELIARVASLPGVESAGLSTRVPMRSTQLPILEFAVEGQAWDPSHPNPRADYRVISPEYFDTVGMTVTSGRDFDSRDRGDSAMVAVISESMARQHFQDMDPLGRRVAWSGDVLRFIGLNGDWRTIVGVVSDVRDFGLTAEPGHVIYQPLTQESSASALFVRTANAPAAISKSVADIVRQLEPDQPIENVETLEAVRTENLAPQRLNLTLLGVFAALALAIAAVGVAGVLSFQVSIRTRELGIRASLGADQGRLLRGVVKEGLLLASVGLAAGTLGALILTRFLTRFLFGVDPTDPATFVGVALLLAAVAAAASFAPAWRAAQTDPATVLRND
ncbi:MAG: ABC transporter permease [Acidobacteriota bacterium]|nr:ABC transporter permease [Acidobacteriota bacterium]